MDSRSVVGITERSDFLCSSLGGNDFKRINLLIQKNINPFVFSETQASGSHR